ncbi:MAG: hypothetical protein PHE40_00230 [Acidocella sp.]|nr:hypothetical protein [Acidocella sp.]
MVSDFAAAPETVSESQVDAPLVDAKLADAPLAAAEVVSVPVSETDPALGLPMFLTSSGDDGVAPLHQPGQGDSFADLVHAARNNEVEYEPEKRPPTPVKTGTLRLVLTLLLLLAAGLAGLAFIGHFGHIV